MSEISKLREKHEQEILDLQEDCSHEKDEWRIWAWAPGHYSGEVRVCVRCGKILERRPQFNETFTIIDKGPITYPTIESDDEPGLRQKVSIKEDKDNG